MTRHTPYDAQALLEQAGWIRSLARRLVGGDADDLVQDTLLVALEKPPGRERALRPWLAGVVKNLAANRQRARRHRGDRERSVAADAGSQEPLPSPDELLARSEQQREVVDAVLRLDEPYRSTLLLRYFEGLEPVAIARRQGIPDGTVRTRLARGVERIRQRLDERNGGDRSRWVQALVPLAGLPGAPLVRMDAPPNAAPPPTAPATSLTSNLFTALLAMPSLFKITLASLPLLAALFWAGRDPVPTAPDLLAVAAPAAGSSAPSDPLAAVDPNASGANRVAAVFAAAPPLATNQDGTGTLTVLDRRTGEPVWGFRFVEPGAVDEDARIIATAAERPAARTTDAMGEVRMPLTLRGLVPIHGYESRDAFMRVFQPHAGPGLGDPVSIEWDDDAGVARVDVGPTIVLDLELPQGVAQDSLFAVLNDRPFADSWTSRPSSVRSFGETTFVRFAPRRVEPSRGLWLHLLTADGRHGRSVALDGKHPAERPIQVVVQERGVLAGSIKADDGGRLSQVEVFLFEGATGPEETLQPWVTNVPRLRMTLGQGVERRDFRYDALPPGTYTLCAHARGFAPHWETLEVAAEVRQHPIELRRVADATGVLEGRITSQTGSYHEALKALASDPNPWMPSDDLMADVSWQFVDGKRVGTFRIEGVVDQPHQITLLGEDRFGNPLNIRRLLPANPLEARPGELVEIELADAVAETTLRVRATDRATGEPVETFDAYWVANDNADTVDGNGYRGEAIIRGIRDIANGQLTVVSDAHVILTLDAEAVDGATTIDVELVPGWSCGLHVQGPGEAPIPLAEVLFDGIRVGSTDDEGFLQFDADTPPARVEIRAAGWCVESSNCLDADGKLLGPFERSARHLSFTMAGVD